MKRLPGLFADRHDHDAVRHPRGRLVADHADLLDLPVHISMPTGLGVAPLLAPRVRADLRAPGPVTLPPPGCARAADDTWVVIRAAALTTGSDVAAGYAVTLEAACQGFRWSCQDVRLSRSPLALLIIRRS